MTDTHFYVLALLAIVVAALQVAALLRARSGNDSRNAFDHLERELRREMQLGAQTARQTRRPAWPSITAQPCSTSTR